MLGARIRALRKAQNLKQVELAEKSGLYQSTLSRIEADALASPRLENLEAIARALGIDLAELLGMKPIRNTRAKRKAS